MTTFCYEEELKINSSKILAANQEILVLVFPFILSIQTKRTQINKGILR